MIVNTIYCLKPLSAFECFNWEQHIRRYYRNFPSKSHINRTSRRKEDVIISLTSIPARINTVWLTIESLLRQSYKPDKILLWLAREEFSEKKLPVKLLKMRKRGLEIHYCENIGSYKKYYFTMLKYPEAVVVTVDDDVIYPENMLSSLMRWHRKLPNDILCHRSHKITFKDSGELKPYAKWIQYLDRKSYERSAYENFPTGAGGVLYPSNSLNDIVFDKVLFLRLAPNADDIWLYFSAILKGTRITNVPGFSGNVLNINNTQSACLAKVNVTKHKNDIYIKGIESYLGKSIKDLIYERVQEKLERD